MSNVFLIFLNSEAFLCFMQLTDYLWIKDCWPEKTWFEGVIFDYEGFRCFTIFGHFIRQLINQLVEENIHQIMMIDEIIMTRTISWSPICNAHLLTNILQYPLLHLKLHKQIFLRLDQMCNMKGVAHSDKPTVTL